ncbi:hypothetical protein ACELLULO517_15805 [Acidisoma cellulosilytica]|uniref:DUF5666 domain-containing protein n=1 Tax=Acidisoma cellulosilyticum TaxID=2802395 RepID=A0A963Z2M2_9PROT|nr:hypothetical protein [Acidisoma cellulosilyticum]MCB8881713.1 hypothetical protein [Acidisoma cellulosilyticum]
MRSLIVIAALIVFPVFAAQAADIRFDALTCELTGAGPQIEGQITNVSNQALKFVEIYATFKDSNGKFLSTSGGIPLEFDPISPGQQTNFRGYGDESSAIATVAVQAGFTGGSSISTTGMTTVDCEQGD